MATRSEAPLTNQQFEQITQQLTAAVLTVGITLGQIASGNINATTPFPTIEESVRDNFKRTVKFLFE